MNLSIRAQQIRWPIIFVAVSWVLSLVQSEVTVMRQVQTLYDRSPKLRIRGSGFDADTSDIVLELGAQSQPLLSDRDYLITKDWDGDGLILKLLGNRTWVDLTTRVAPVALVLNSVKFKTHPNPNQDLLVEPVIVALVLGTPAVVGSDTVIYATGTNELRINGTGLVGAKKVDLYLNPPLIKEVAYEDVTSYPIYSASSQIILRIRHGYKWREVPGPLSVIGIDTGGGAVKTDGDVGVHVATVVGDTEGPTVTVEATASSQLIYDDEPTVIISGSGFNPISNVLRFSNGLLGNNVNYTAFTTESKITLRLVPGSHWRKNVENLPGALTLLAVNAGGGFVAVGPLNSGKGRDIATVFERPAIYPSDTQLFRTQSHELHIQGTGFPDLMSGYIPQLRFFESGLVQGLNYTLRVVGRTELVLTLVDGMAWRSWPGPLQVKLINTRGDDAGWVEMPGAGIQVAQVVDDTTPSDPINDIQVIPGVGRVYQSALQQRITLHGLGLQSGMRFNFDNLLVQYTDFEVSVISPTTAWLSLRASRRWRSTPGPLVLRSIILPDARVIPLGGLAGITVAVILADPQITASTAEYHNSQSKTMVIRGSGFTNIPDTTLALQPTPSAAYKIVGVLSDAVHIQLNPVSAWLSHIALGPGSRVPILLHSIDTGPGEVVFPQPITIGIVVPDLPDVDCDDSCEFAFDGICDNTARSDDYEEYHVPACIPGTDCTDCGGVDAIKIKVADDCTNDCVYAKDGVCDDPRGFGYCALGTDCDDCGPVSAGNHTVRSIIRDTSATQRVYSDQAVVFLAATVLHPTGSAFRWSNKMRGDGVDYDVDLVDHTTLALRRSDGFEWERRFYQLPTVLYLEAVNDGMGTDKFRTLPGHGVGVATVFPRPSILPGALKLFRTASSELHLQGAGFPPPGSGFGVSLQFSPALRLDHDYTVRVVSHTDLFIQLSAGASWRAQPGALMVTGVNTAGGDENWVWFAGEGVRVADVHWDPDEGSWSRQMLTAGAVVLVLVLCGMCFWRSGRGGTATTAQPAHVEVRYQKVASSERDLEMTTRGASSAGGMLGLVAASEVIVCADVEEADVEDCNGGVDSGNGPIRDAVYSDQHQDQGVASAQPALDSAV